MFTTKMGLFCSCGRQGYYECGGMMTPCSEQTYRRYAEVALCEGRHEIKEAEDGAIFGNTLDPRFPTLLYNEAEKVISESGVESLYVYVTGLSVALVAVINACHKLGVELTLYHYDRDTGKYIPQEVL